MQKENKQGFTLIELLVVVAIILLLSGMLYRIGNLVDARAKRANTIARMQNIANALEEYHVVYGTYPNPPDSYTITVTTNNIPERVLDMDYDRRKELGLMFGEKIGLPSFLISDGMPFKTNAPHEFISWDSPTSSKTPDKNTRMRWREFLDADGKKKDHDFVGDPEGWRKEKSELEVPIPGVDIPVFRTAYAFKDAWNGDLVYVSKFPNLSYSLVSKGPDHKLGTEDDVSVSSSGQ